MQQSKSGHGFAIPLIAAASIWYGSQILSYVVTKFHTRQTINSSLWYGKYSSAFYDGFQQHFFYISFIALSVICGFALKFFPFERSRRSNRILLSSALAIIFIPLAATGLNGAALATDWPAVTPPLEFHGGFLLCLPGAVILLYALLSTHQHSCETNT